jgi:hypothetical protein
MSDATQKFRPHSSSIRQNIPGIRVTEFNGIKERSSTKNNRAYHQPTKFRCQLCMDPSTTAYIK